MNETGFSALRHLKTMEKKRSSAFAILIILVSSILFLTYSLPIPTRLAEAQTFNPSCISDDHHDRSLASGRLQNSSTQTITLLCGSATLSDIRDMLNDTNMLVEESNKVWLLNADLVIEEDASIAITSHDTSWLKIETPHGLVSYGDVLIDSVKLTSWNSTINSYAQTNGQQPRSFLVVPEHAPGQMNITNSEIAYLGYGVNHMTGISYYSGHGSIVKNNNIHHMWYGFYSNGVGFMKIENNSVHDSVAYGIDPHSGTHDMLIRNNVVKNITKGVGIICSVCSNIQMENNVIYDANGAGLMISRNTTNSIIRNNLVYNSGIDGAGVSVDDSSGNQVYNNTITMGKNGMKISKNSSNNHIFNNTITNYQRYGICIIDGSSNNIIHDNIIINAGDYGICIQSGSSENEVYSNQIIGTGSYGIFVSDPDALNNVFKFNSILNSGQNGVSVLNNTAATFINNTVLASTKTEYSATNSKLMLYNTTFSSAYFEGTQSEVDIVNSNTGLIAGDRILNNIVEANGRVTVGFLLTNSETAVLDTLPFVVKPQGSTINVSILEGRITNGAAQVTWIENTTVPGKVTAVYHRVEGLSPGLPVNVTSSDSGRVTEKHIRQEGILEFSTKLNGTEKGYSILSSGVDFGNALNETEIFRPDSKYNLKIYNCQIYGEIVRCDPQLSDITSYSVDGVSRVVKPLSTLNAAFVDGKYDKAIKFSARYRESVEVMNTAAINTERFSFSFWLRNSDEAGPYGHIVSHVNRQGTAGWFVDMSSTTASQPFIQRLMFGVTNTQGVLVAPAEVVIPQGRFVNVAGIFDGSVAKIFVDGQLAGEAPFIGDYNPDPGTPLRIGSASYSSSNHRWSGILDDLLLFNGTLSASEVLRVATQPKDGEFADDYSDTNALIAHWSLENDVRDVTGNGNDGVLTTLLASMAFAPDGRLFLSEKNTGNIKIMKDNVILEEPFAHLPDVYVSWEQGVLGLTLDKNFEENHYVYQYYTYMDPSNGEVFNRVVRFKDVENKGTEIKVLLDKIPAVKGFHSGGALAFGPDDKLYITVGDATKHAFAQDPNIVLGKVLRINRDGTIPSDNPNPNSPIYTKGHRNAYGLAFDDKGIGIITENGDVAYDEINVIAKGGNYGFPTLQPVNTAPELADPTTSILPVRSYFETIAPTQALYYKGDKIPQFKDRFLFGTYSGDIYAISIDPDSEQVTAELRIDLFPVPGTPVFGIAQAPNGDIYFGSYAIFKLDSIDLPTTMPFKYPIKIATSEGAAVDNLAFVERNRITLDVSMTPSGLSSGPAVAEASPTSSGSVSIMVPKALMDKIATVQAEGFDKPIKFTVTSGGRTSSSGGYHVVTVTLDGMKQDSKVTVIGARVIPEFPLSQLWIMLSMLGFTMAAAVFISKLKLGYAWRA